MHLNDTKMTILSYLFTVRIKIPSHSPEVCHCDNMLLSLATTEQDYVTMITENWCTCFVVVGAGVN